MKPGPAGGVEASEPPWYDSLGAAATMIPLSVYLPFNRESLGEAFVPAKRAAQPPEERGYWLIVQEQGLIVIPEGDRLRLPEGVLPSGFDVKPDRRLWLGTFHGTPCWAASLARDSAVPEGFHRETLIPMRGTRLSDDLLSLGGMALQALYWESTSGHCPRCGELTERIRGRVGEEVPALPLRALPPSPSGCHRPG